MEKLIALSDAEVATVAGGGGPQSIDIMVNSSMNVNSPYSFNTNSFNIDSFTNSFNTGLSGSIMPGNSAFGRMHHS
jgi:hypothetical protein